MILSEVILTLSSYGWVIAKHTGITQRDGMGKEVGGGFGMEEHMYTCGWFMSM